MLKLIMMKGLPASGKSTIAKAMVEELGYVRTNKDELRLAYPKLKENRIIQIRDGLIIDAMREGKNVVVDDTNFNPIHKKTLEGFAKQYGYQFEEVFVDTPLEECMKRDNARANGVGEKVIRGMYNQYLRERIPLIPLSADGTPTATICDIDGTLAHMTKEGRLRFGRQAPYMWKYVGEDELDPFVHGVISCIRLTSDQWFDGTHKIILVSGRDEICRPETEQWLKDNGVPYDLLYMRPEGDNRKDTVIKEEIYEKHIKGKYSINGVFDDRDQVVEMWRNKGLKVFQVAEGDF